MSAVAWGACCYAPPFTRPRLNLLAAEAFVVSSANNTLARAYVRARRSRSFLLADETRPEAVSRQRWFPLPAGRAEIEILVLGALYSGHHWSGSHRARIFFFSMPFSIKPGKDKRSFPS